VICCVTLYLILTLKMQTSPRYLVPLNTTQKEKRKQVSLSKGESHVKAVLLQSTREEVAGREEREAILLSGLVSFLRRDGPGWLMLDPGVQYRNTDN
jgi:hypothetical protein